MPEDWHSDYTPLHSRSPDPHVLEGADNLQGSSPLTLTQMAQPIGGRAEISTEVSPGGTFLFQHGMCLKEAGAH